MVHPKLDEEDIRIIREVCSYGVSQRKIAEMFDVAKATIQRWTSEEYRKGEAERQRLRDFKSGFSHGSKARLQNSKNPLGLFKHLGVFLIRLGRYFKRVSRVKF